MREETERPEGLDAGTLELVGHDRAAIVAAARALLDRRGRVRAHGARRQPVRRRPGRRADRRVAAGAAARRARTRRRSRRREGRSPPVLGRRRDLRRSALCSGSCWRAAHRPAARAAASGCSAGYSAGCAGGLLGVSASRASRCRTLPCRRIAPGGRSYSDAEAAADLATYRMLKRSVSVRSLLDRRAPRTGPRPVAARRPALALVVGGICGVLNTLLIDAVAASGWWKRAASEASS